MKTGADSCSKVSSSATAGNCNRLLSHGVKFAILQRFGERHRDASRKTVWSLFHTSNLSDWALTFPAATCLFPCKNCIWRGRQDTHVAFQVHVGEKCWRKDAKLLIFSKLHHLSPPAPYLPGWFSLYLSPVISLVFVKSSGDLIWSCRVCLFLPLILHKLHPLIFLPAVSCY